MLAACEPTLALSIFAVTTSSRSSALSMPVAVNDSTSPGLPSSTAAGGVLTPPSPPPAAIAPGPAGFATLGGAFFAPALGGAFTFAGALDSSSARRRAFSALRASSARRFSSLSSFALLASFDPLDHLSASLRSWETMARCLGCREGELSELMYLVSVRCRCLLGLVFGLFGPS